MVGDYLFLLFLKILQKGRTPILHYLRFRRWLKAYRFIEDINERKINWAPLGIFYRKHPKPGYYVDYSSEEYDKVTAVYLANIHYYTSYA
jgi:hypothetical protein